MRGEREDTRPRRFAVLDCEDAPHWAGHARFWVDQLARPDERWEVFRPWAGELPSSAADHDAIVITGSHHSVNDAALPWRSSLFDFVRRVVDHPRGGRVLGACFGLQVVTCALGGRVDANPCGRFVFGTERVHFMRAWHAMPFASPDVPTTATLLSSHGEQAIELPAGACTLARSETSEHELYAVGERVLCAQFHAELTREALIELILPALRSDRRLTPAHEAAALASLDEPVHDTALMASFRAFVASESLGTSSDICAET